MFISYSSLFFFFTLVGGVVLSVSSDSWFGAWCGLELNLMSFIPFISSKADQYSSEACLKYFLIQALGSSIIILGFVFTMVSMVFVFFMTLALLLKLGAVPGHFWFPQVMEGLSWNHCLVLMTVQKVAPMYLISYSIYYSSSLIVFLSSIFSAVVGAIGGINQMLLRKLLAFSSINHMAWMLMSMLMGESAWVLYFMLYVLVSMSIIMLFNYQQFFHLNQMSNFTNYKLGLVSFLSLLSLGGLPPFTGFLPKWIIIQELVLKNYFLTLLIFLLSSLVTLYYYLRLTIMYMTFISPKLKFNLSLNTEGKNTALYVSLNFIGLIIPSMFVLL